MAYIAEETYNKRKMPITRILKMFLFLFTFTSTKHVFNGLTVEKLFSIGPNSNCSRI